MARIATLATVETVTEAISRPNPATMLVLSGPSCPACKRLLDRVARSEEIPGAEWVKVDLDQLPTLPGVLGLQVMAVPQTLLYRAGQWVAGFGPQTRPGKVVDEARALAVGGAR